MKIFITILAIFAIGAGLLYLNACKQPETKATTATELPDSLKTPMPDWAKDAVIYEVNWRQFTPEGTIAAFEKHLVRLKNLGVDVLWFMPVNPISEEKRKEGLGSYYAVADYRGGNPELGTMDEFKNMVQKIHELGMKIIIDWVPNHTGWDHPWIKEHPEFYTQDAAGNIIDPVDPATGKSWGWTDVADLNYDNKEMRKAMLSDMCFWLTDVGIDGFRMDVAHNVPNDFWDEARETLFTLKPDIFMLAEAEVPYFRNSGDFAADYGWSLHHLLNDIAKGKKPASALDEWLKTDREKNRRGFHMQFITNHDENSWNGTEYERMGEGVDAFAVLTFTFDGMPLIYTGQESAFNRRFKFFTKDSTDWGDYSKADFYRTLVDLKHKNKALWNGEYGGAVQKIATGHDDKIYAFVREKEGDKVLVVLNLSPDNVEFTLDSDLVVGEYNNVFAASTQSMTEGIALSMKPWEYLVLSNR